MFAPNIYGKQTTELTFHTFLSLAKKFKFKLHYLALLFFSL